MERKLASIQRIKEILPIEGADMIELVVVNSWKVVAAKSVGHKVGDLVVYCEIDSFLPVEPEFEFLRKSSFKKMGDQEGFRLKTIKLRGQISQGLILPLRDAEEVMNRKSKDSVLLLEGIDVSENLGIVKYDPPVPANLAGKVKGNFPSFLRKTDEERCLSAETIIFTEHGKKTIKEICESVYTGKVLSYNPFSDEDEWNKITSHTIRKNNNDWFEIELENGDKLITTGNHRVWLPDLLCYREVRELTTEDSLKKTDLFSLV